MQAATRTEQAQASAREHLQPRRLKLSGLSLCRDVATILTRLLRLEGCPLLPAQSDVSVEAVMRQANSWVVQTTAGQRSVEYAAFLQLGAASP